MLRFFFLSYFLIKIIDSNVHGQNEYLENDGNQLFFSEFLENFDENYAQLNQKNEEKFYESLTKCYNKITNKTSQNLEKKTSKHLCISDNPYIDNIENTFLNYGNGKLFAYDNNIIGLVTNSEQSIRFFYFNPSQKSFIQFYKKVFHEKVPFDACVDNSKNIYLVFPDEQLIGKYVLDTKILDDGNLKTKLSEIYLKEENDYYPSSISCYQENIYVSERPTNMIKVYDKNFNLLRNIEINGVVISAHRSIDVNQNIRIFTDDSSGVAFFNPIKHSESSLSEACHFYYKKNCVEGVFSIPENKNRTHIYIADSCTNEIKQITYTKTGDIFLKNSFPLHSKPRSVLVNENDYLFVLTNSPPKINVFYPHECKFSIASLKKNKH